MMPYITRECLECGREVTHYEVISTHGHRCQCGAPLVLKTEADFPPEEPEDELEGIYSWERTANL